MNKTEIFTRSFDIEGNQISRVCRLSLLAKILPVGNLRGGPGIRCLLTLLVVHLFGETIFSLAIRQEARLHRIYLYINRLRRR